MTLKEPSPRVLGPEDGELLGDTDLVMDRFMVGGAESEGRFALLEHRLAPRALAAPLHLHTQEDEYSYVIEGRVGAQLGASEVFAEPGDLVFKPKGQWHTFWNAGDSPARILEIICPAGLEELFRELDLDPDLMEPERLLAAAARYGADIDFEATIPIIERHNLRS